MNIIDTVRTCHQLAVNKAQLVQNRMGAYFLLSIMAGIYVGFGVILAFSVGAGFFENSHMALKVVMGTTFGIALTLVIFAGSELFTGNNMVMVIGKLAKKTSWSALSKVWTVSFLGNFAGSFLLAGAFVLTGLAKDQGPLHSFIMTASAGKMSAPFIQLLFRGILCNILVCLAVWTALRTKSDAAKCILIFWCLLAFIASGFEHSVANMTLLSMALLLPHPPDISVLGLINNLIPVTLGNIIGGSIVMGGIYYYISGGDKKTDQSKRVPLSDEYIQINVREQNKTAVTSNQSK